MEPVSLNPIHVSSVSPQILREYYGLASQLARETVLNSSEYDKRLLKESVAQINSLMKKSNDSEYKQVDMKKYAELLESFKTVVEKLGLRLELKNNANGLFCRVLNEINGREMGTIPMHMLVQKVDMLLRERNIAGSSSENGDASIA